MLHILKLEQDETKIASTSLFAIDKLSVEWNKVCRYFGKLI